MPIKIAEDTLDGIVRKIGFKVVTHDMKSLGLRGNPKILEYSVGEWLFLPREDVVPGKSDYGGIWLARTIGNARKLQTYMKDNYSEDARIFKAVINEVLYSNDFRIKTNGVMFYEEVLR
jgi:hypothetical protein